MSAGLCAESVVSVQAATGARNFMARLVVTLRFFGVGAGRRFASALASLLVLGAAASEAAPRDPQVLVLQSFERGNLTLDVFTANFRVDLARFAGRPVNLIQVIIAPAGFVVPPEQAIVDYVRAAFADRPNPDLIVSVAGPAAVFARKHRQELFPDTPLLFAAVDQQYLGDTPLGENETAVAVNNDFPRLVDDILQLLPGTKQLFMVMGAGQMGRFWHERLERDFARFRDRLTFVWSDELSLSDIERRCADLPSDAAIFYLTFGTDAQGAAYADERVLADLKEKASVPMFSLMSPMFGRGIVGGPLMSIEGLGRRTADVAAQLVNGTSPRTLRPAPQRPGDRIFDARALKKWNIADSRLPAGSMVLFREPTLWQEHATTILIAGAALAIQSVLIIGLFSERRARHRAEMASRRNLALATDVSRRATMSALSSSITHELGQPLTSIANNAHALQMMVSANSATSDTVGEILSDIRTQGVRAAEIIHRHRAMLRSRPLDRQPTDLYAVLDESLALLAHDLRSQQVDVIVQPPSHACVIDADQVLLQQVFVNLVMNAMDAMAETPPARRRVTIVSEVSATHVVVSVRDNGTGLPPHMIGNLFTPFATTKAHGLGIGLTIARTIVDAHDGTLDAHNSPEGGATFTVTLRCRHAPRLRPRVPARRLTV
jgi:signal transduction histidine kinase